MKARIIDLLKRLYQDTSDIKTYTSRLTRNTLQFLDGTLIVYPRFFYKIYQGYGFASSKRFEGIASGNHIDILFMNPENSGREIFITMVEITGLAQLYADIYVNNTITNIGTKINILNLRPAMNITPVAIVSYNGTYTLGTLIYNVVVPGGTRIRATGGQASIGETVVLDEGVNFIMRVTNASASDTDFSVRALWWEEPI